MRLGLAGGVLVVVAIAVAIVAYSALFTVPQTQQALVVRLGQPVGAPITEPGLHVKMPLIDSVIYVDKRILDLETSTRPSAPGTSRHGQVVITSDTQQLIVDAFARYRIHDALRFYQTLGTLNAANSQLQTLFDSAMKRVLGEASLIHVVRDERSLLMGRVREQLGREAQAFGITIVDVRIKHADLPDQNSQSVIERMKTERLREAAEFRAQGSQKGQEIRAKADRDVTVIIAEATQKSEQFKGEGDGERNRIFADAFSRDPDFFAFYRSMQAYEAALRSNDTRMLLRSDSEFFRFFVDPSGKPKDGAVPPGPRQPAPQPAPPR